jgi:predicted permease
MGWFSRLFRRAKADAELDEEIRFYLDQEARLRIDRGEAPEQARASARRDFGNVLLVKETTRDVWGWSLLEDLGRDLRYAVRLLARSPMFAAMAVLSLALGIGANTAIFSLADAVIFRSLPVPEPQQLVQVRAADDKGRLRTIYSYPDYVSVMARTQVFTSMASAGSWATVEPITLELTNEPARELRARLTAVTGNYFQTLGVRPAMGRVLTPEDDRTPGAHPVAVISHRFWRRALDGDPRAVGSRVRHNEVGYVILGVTPPAFSGISSNDDPDIWVPMMMANAVIAGELIAASSSSSLYVFGRLKPGAGLQDANADLTRVFRELRTNSPKAEPLHGDAVSMAKGVQTLRARFEMPLRVLLAAVGLLLLVACANLAALLLARAAARRDEIAMRLSLGASRFRLVRQLLTESLLLGLLGGAAGLLVSAWGASLLVNIVTTSTRRLPIYFTIDTRILAFTVGLSVIAAVLFGLVPALQARRTQVAPGSAGTPPARLAGHVILVGQMALSVFLLIAAGLFVRSLANLRSLDTGFARENVAVLMLDPRVAYGRSLDKYMALYRDLPARIDAVAGVRSASMSSASFFGSGSSRSNVTYEGQPGEAPENEWPLKVGITPRFTETLGLTLLMGRSFTDRDHRTAPKVALVSESIAKRYFAGSHPIGKRFSFDSTFQPDAAIEIVGVVRDGRWSSLRQTSPYMVYLPFEQALTPRADLQVRTWADPTAVIPEVQRVLAGHDPGVRVTHAVTLERLVEDSIIQDRLLALLAGSFGMLALLLSSLGLYGVTAHGVHRRTSEIGLRMALGASSRSLHWMVLREVLVLALAGAAIGVSAALAASGVVRTLLFGVAPTDPWTILAAATVLVGVAAGATYLPARRACRIDPIRALRCQ